MKLLRLLVHSFVMTAVNLGAAIASYGVYWLFRPANQGLLQAPVAAVISIGVFLLWYAFARRWGAGKWALAGKNELALVYLLALAWAPALFYPMHYLTQGYLAAFANIIAIWAFQIAANLLTMLLVTRMNGPGNNAPPKK